MDKSTPTSYGSRTSSHPQIQQRADDRLKNFVEMIPAVAWCSDLDGCREFHTKSWHDFTGLSPSEASGVGWHRAVHPKDLAHLLRRCVEIRASGEPGATECRIRRFDGQYRWFSTTAVPYRNDRGELVNWFGCNVDIENQKQIERRLQQGADELRNVIDAIAEVIAVLAPDGTFMYANLQFRTYTGLAATHVESGEFRALAFHPDELEMLATRRRAGLAVGAPFDTEARIRRHDGQYRWHQVRYSPLRDEHHQIIRWYATGIDVHDQRVAATRLQNENLALREEITGSSMFEEIIGSSAPMRRVLEHVAKVAKSESTVLILGETGTGKELIARAVHAHSARSAKAFIRVNCAAIPPSLIASELFGHEKGAFTGAVQRRAGRFEAADGGTLFLDEIGDLPAETQVSLLRVLQEHEFERIGSNTPLSVDVRVVAATNSDLTKAVASGAFRQDLFYRLNVFPIQLPSLRDRVADIPMLAEYFIERYARKSGKRITRIAKPTISLFKAYHWPGNIRELQNVIERAVILCEGELFSIEESWLSSARLAPGPSTDSLETALVGKERELITGALAASGGHIAGAAAKLQLPRQTLASKMKSLGITRP